jgi:hypothetical protein
MARTLLHLLQSTIAAQLLADAWFQAVPVFADTGKESDDIAQSIAETGFCVVVDPIENVTRLDAARGMALARASFSVEVWENPAVNPGSLNKNILEGVSKVLRIVTLFDSGPGEAQCEPDADLASLLVTDAGARCYLLNFSKIVQLS